MNKFVVVVILTSVLFLSVSPVITGEISPVSPAVTGPIVKGTSSCNTDYGWKLTKYNNRESCVFCDEKRGWHYAKYNGRDSCVRCDEKGGWKYDGKRFCVKQSN